MPRISSVCLFFEKYFLKKGLLEKFLVKQTWALVDQGILIEVITPFTSSLGKKMTWILE